MSDSDKIAYKPTPNATLEQQIMDSRIPKNEREWWAHKEIERLREEIGLNNISKKGTAEIIKEAIAAEREACAVGLPSVNFKDGKAYSYCPECGLDSLTIENAVAAEREACAKIAEKVEWPWTPKRFAAAIRNRVKQN